MKTNCDEHEYDAFVLDENKYDKGLNELALFLAEKQRELLSLFDDGLDEFSPQAIFGEGENNLK